MLLEIDKQLEVRNVGNINAYLAAAQDVFVEAVSKVPEERAVMQFGNHPYYANALMLRAQEGRELILSSPASKPFVRPLYGSKELIDGLPRSCIWIKKETLDAALQIPSIKERIDRVAVARREKSKDSQSQKLIATPYRFRDQYEAKRSLLVVPIVSSEERSYLPIDLVSSEAIVHNKAFALYDAPLWNMALIASRLHWVWIGTVCVRLEMRFSYSNTLGWNTFPVPILTEQNKADLTRCAEDILLAREQYFPATIADMYDPDRMDSEFPLVREAHERNDETLERIYIGRRFKNDTERLEKLFELYTKMTARQAGSAKPAKRTAKNRVL